MHILSIDVGIKNLAHCLVKVNSDKGYDIVLWDTVNLSEGLLPICSNPNCKDLAKYTNRNNTIFCNKHAKNTDLIIPDKSILKYKSLKLSELNDLVKKYELPVPNEKITKAVLSKVIEEFLNEKCIKPLENSCLSDISLIKLGVKVKEKYDKIFKDYTIDKIVIENQISPIAGRMKALQAMITQYFIDCSITDIHYISSANKLKDYDDQEIKTYNKRKKMSIDVVNKILEEENEDWKDIFKKSKKKDDMADTLLQVIHFIKNNIK